MRMKMKTRPVWRVSVALAALGALVAVAPAQAGLVAHYTFDNADSTKTGDGSMGDPFNGTISDVANGNTATNISTQEQNASVPPPGGTGVYGMQMQQGQPGVFGESHMFWRDPSNFRCCGAGSTAKATTNGTYHVPDGVAPIGDAPRSFSLWFNQEADTTGQDKFFGYGNATSGQAFDVGIEGDGLRIRHFGGNATWDLDGAAGGQAFDFDGVDAGWHHLLVRVNDVDGLGNTTVAATFANVDMVLDGVLLKGYSTGGSGLTTVINTTNNVNGDGFGIGTTSITENDSTGSSQNGFQGRLDDFKIYDMAVPEPASAMLMMLGLTGSLLAVRRQRS